MNKCKIEGCEGRGTFKKNGTEVFSLGLCSKHYNRKNKYGDPHFIKITQGENRGLNPLYKVYAGIKRRCYNKNEKSYKYYGEIGITISDRRLGNTGFSNFLEDMGNRPEGTSIDRINNNGNYEPNNCRRASMHEQARNRSNNNEIVGLSVNKTKKSWEVSLRINKVLVLHKCFKVKQEAINARRNAELFYNIYK